MDLPTAPANRFFIDLETRSSVDLRRYGVYAYAASEDFDILLVAWAVGEEPVQWAPWSEARPVIEAAIQDPGTILVAHNAQFERVALSRALGVWRPDAPDSFLPASRFEDTAVMARRLGLPPHLAALAAYLGGEQKEEAGRDLIRWFSLPIPGTTRFRAPSETPEKWRAFGEYCRQDVQTHRDMWRRLKVFPRDARVSTEREVWLTDQRIADRGVLVDVPTCRLAQEAFQHVRTRAVEEASAIAGVENANSVAQLRPWLSERLGREVPDLRKETVAALLAEELPDDVRRVLQLRQESSLNAGAKYETFARMAVPWDNRLRGSLVYFGAQATGRWAAKGLNVQNMPHDKVSAEEAERKRALLHAGAGVSAQDLKELIRSMLVGPFVVSDFSQVESRTLAFLAKDRATLKIFRDGRDLYTEVAASLGHGMTRQHGKIATLALGYAGSVGALKAFGGDKLGDDKFLFSMVRSWRESHPEVVALWHRLQDDLVSGTGWFIRDPDRPADRGLRLPSGRLIWYRDCAQRQRVREFTNYETGETYTKEVTEITCMDPAKPRVRRVLSPNVLTNNLVQGTARDIQAEALLRLDHNGYDVVTHVHDEVVVETPTPEADKTLIAELMSTTPSWAPGLPLASEPYTCDRYLKE